MFGSTNNLAIMKPILIHAKNSAEIEKQLFLVNAGARVHTINTYSEVLFIANIAEQRISDLLNSRSKFGVVFSKTSGHSTPLNYKWRRNATKITIKRKNNGWNLVEVERILISNQAGKTELVFTEKHRLEAIKFLETKFKLSAT